MSELNRLTIEQMREGLLRREFSASELVSAHLEQIERTNPKYNSFITVCADHAISQAKAADKVLASDKDRSPRLTGIPVAVKDMLITEGIRTTCASKILENFVPPYNCTAVTKLQQNGAILIGKTNMDEFAMGSSNENSSFGPVRNPWDTERVPGGSSGGSAVAVALGQAPLSLGTDTGGSIRQPASLTGVVGIKPTYGRVSRYGAVAFASSLDQIGPFARTVSDLSIALGVIAGADPNDSTAIDTPVPDYYAELKALSSRSLKGIRIGIPKQYFIEGIEPEVESCIRGAIEKLKELGAQVVDINLPYTEHALAAYYIIAPAEASSNLARYDGVRYGHRTQNAENLSEMYARSRAEGFGPEVRRRILVGTYVLSAGYYDAYYRKAQEVRTLIINDFKAAFNNSCDVIACPAAPTTAFKLGEKTDSPLQMYLEDVFTIPANLGGIPGISVPAGRDSKGLPIGLQLLGAPFQESNLFKVAYGFESVSGFDTTQVIA